MKIYFHLSAIIVRLFETLHNFFSHELTNFTKLDVENFIELGEIALKGNSISEISLDKSTSK